MYDQTHGNAFNEVLRQMDKPSCVRLALQLIDSGVMDLVELYAEVLAPALNQITRDEENEATAIWREHIRSSIIRTIIECCYPRVIETIEKQGIQLDKGKVVLVSPADEYHELGLRMGADFFTLCGYQALYVGSDTPQNELIDGLKRDNPDYVVINAVNFYNVFKVKKLVAAIKDAVPDVKVLCSGQAFRHDPTLQEQIGALALIETIDDIRNLEGGII
jgi:methanogenic corrinoid protein MtbC1